MDATRSRRSRDPVRQRWYGSCRTLRFARHMQFLQPAFGSQLSAFGNRQAAGLVTRGALFASGREPEAESREPVAKRPGGR
jgi:hypothetical protein